GSGRAGPGRVCTLWTSESLCLTHPSFWWHSLSLVFSLISARGGSTRDRGEAETEGRLVRSAPMDEQISDAAVRVRSLLFCFRGLNPGLVVLLVVGGLILLFLLGNYALYMYAQKTLPPRRKKPISKK
ncbi:unnamed protein product, partial [Musa acuminata subsp. burmannicoides]